MIVFASKLVGYFLGMAASRFPPPWTIEEHAESFWVCEAKGRALAYLYFEDELQRQVSIKRLSQDEAGG